MVNLAGPSVVRDRTWVGHMSFTHVEFNLFFSGGGTQRVVLRAWPTPGSAITNHSWAVLSGSYGIPGVKPELATAMCT